MVLTRLLFAAVAFAAAVPLSLVLEAQARNVPSGWFKAGKHPDDYDVGTDQNVKRSGSASAFVKSRSSAATGFGTSMQTFTADDYLGKRVRLFVTNGSPADELRPISPEDGAPAWDTEARDAQRRAIFPNGEYIVTVTAWDSHGNAGHASDRVIVSNH